MVLGDPTEHREPCHLLVREHLCLLSVERDVDLPGPLRSVREDLDELPGDEPVHDLAGALVVDVVVGRDRARHDGLTEAPRSLDDRHRLARHRVRGEHDPRLLRVDELLDHHGDVDQVIVEALLGPVIDGAGTVQRGPALLHCLEQVLFAANVEERLLLAGERGVGQVLGRRGRAHRDDQGLGSELPVGRPDILGDLRRHRGREHELLCLARRRLERLVALHVEPSELREDPLLELRLDQKPTEGLGRNHEGLGHGEPERGHLAEAGPLAADRRDVLLADLLEHQGVGYILWNAGHFAPLSDSKLIGMSAAADVVGHRYSRVKVCPGSGITFAVG